MVLIAVAAEQCFGKEPPVTFTATGRVFTEPGGEPVPGVKVILEKDIFSKPKKCVTDHAGNYTFTGLSREESYVVAIGKRPNNEKGVLTEGIAIEEGVKQDLQLDHLYLKLPQCVTGQVVDIDTGEPIPDASVKLGNDSYVYTDEEGRYRFYLNPGNYKYGYGLDDHLRYSWLHYWHLQYKAFAEIYVGPGEQIEVPPMYMRSGPPFELHVVDSQGRAVPNAKL